MIRAVPLMLIVALAACDVERKPSGSDDENVAIQGNADGKIKFDVPFVKGEIQLPQSMTHDGELDIDGVKLMPGSKLTGFSIMAGEGKEDSVQIAYSSPKPPAEVTTYFLGEFHRTGAKAESHGNAIDATTKDGDTVSVTAEADGGGTKGMISLRSKD